jgi:hypothetical protein
VNITSAVDEFMMKFAMALGVVLLVSLLSLGWRVGIVVAAAVPLSALMQEVMKTADSPEIVAQRVVEAATTKSPRLRYTSGKVVRQASVLRRFVPERMFDKSLRKQMGLPA